MDHLPFILQQKKGAEGFVFHGGATDENGHWDQVRLCGQQRSLSPQNEAIKTPYWGSDYRTTHRRLAAEPPLPLNGCGAVLPCVTRAQALAYGYHHGRIYNPLLAVSMQLTDAAEGDGGFVVVRGSHKVRAGYAAALFLRRFEPRNLYRPYKCLLSRLLTKPCARLPPAPFAPEQLPLPR